MLRAVFVLAIGAACSRAASERDLRELGDQTFRDICAKCHGQNGHGGLPLTPGGPRPRDFSDLAWQQARTDAQLAEVIRGGKPPMPAFEAVLSAEQIDAAVAKVRRIGREAKR
jgi:cytochrome c oxidase subunit 2